MSKEFCIMPPSPLYKTERFDGSHRHEVFFGKNRQKSIKDGLVVFLRPEMHNASSKGVHSDLDFNMALKCIGQRTAMEYYGWSKQQFIDRYGKSYLDEPYCERCHTYKNIERHGEHYYCPCCYDDLKGV